MKHKITASVYALICPIENLIKYIGVTDNIEARYKSHFSAPMKSTKEWIDLLKSKQMYFIMKEIKTFDKKHEAFDYEKMFISEVEEKQGGLLNIAYNPKHMKHNFKSNIILNK